MHKKQRRDPMIECGDTGALERWEEPFLQALVLSSFVLVNCIIPFLALLNVILSILYLFCFYNIVN
ncbi:MAG: hypothetical protein ABUK19_04945 [Desulfobacteria bacterium]